MAIFEAGEPLDIDALNALASDVKLLNTQVAAQKSLIGELSNAAATTASLKIPKVYAFRSDAVKPSTTPKNLTINYSDAQYKGIPIVVVTPVYTTSKTTDVNLNFYVNTITNTSAVITYSAPFSSEIRFNVMTVYMESAQI